MTTTRKTTTGLMLTFFPAIIAFVVTYGTLGDSEASLATDPATQRVVFELPVDMNKARVTTPFGERLNPATGKKSMHTGLDLASRLGEPVVAASTGTVIKAISDKTRGNWIVVRHDQNYSTSYSHLKSMTVTAGQVIESGTVIGFVGSTGLSSGPHLHFEILKDGNAVDPSVYLPIATK